MIKYIFISYMVFPKDFNNFSQKKNKTAIINNAETFHKKPFWSFVT